MYKAFLRLNGDLLTTNMESLTPWATMKRLNHISYLWAVEVWILTIHCMQVPVLLKTAVIFVLFATDVTRVAKIVCKNENMYASTFRWMIGHEHIDKQDSNTACERRMALYSLWESLHKGVLAF